MNCIKYKLTIKTMWSLTAGIKNIKLLKNATASWRLAVHISAWPGADPGNLQREGHESKWCP